MPAAARALGVDKVFSVTGSGYHCLAPVVTSTGNTGSPNIFINGSPAVRLGDVVGVHTRTGCGGPDTSVLTTGSSKVFINGQPAGRIGDQYTADNTITTGSPTVFFG